MNLVIDEAVEVRLATKDKEETRTTLGMHTCMSLVRTHAHLIKDKYCSKATTFLLYKQCKVEQSC